MDEETAAEVARWLLVAAGHQLDAYETPRVSRETAGWFVHFSGRSGAPGDHLGVDLDEGTYESRIVLGR